MQLKDRRVDKMLRRAGFADADIYHSPIATWLLLLFFVAASAAWLVWWLLTSLWGLLLVPYLLAAYLVNARSANSFALQDGKLLVVNPNLPFRKMRIFNSREIGLVRIDQAKRAWPRFFLQAGDNYLEITHGGKTARYCCAGLELDAFDENWTEKTIDDLHAALLRAGVPTVFALDR